ncbi:MAG: DUF2752 domain-containing protein [Fibrobacteres bacterium]|nr:DUF2752 domain-containing protein [Fibrobacterota bacterium]
MQLRFAKLQPKDTDAEALYLAVVGSASFLWFFFKKQLDLILFCPFKIITGIPCPTCGFTRSFTLVIKGQFYDAFSLSPLFTLVILASFVAAVYSFAVVVLRLPRIRIEFAKSSSVRIAILIIMFLFTLNWIRSIYYGL